MIGLYLCLAILLFFLFIVWNRKTSYDIIVIWGLYFISSLLALFYNPTNLTGFRAKDAYSDFYFVLYGILVVYALSPLYHIRNKEHRPFFRTYRFSIIEKRLIFVTIIGSVFAIIYAIPYAFSSLYLGAREVRVNVLNSEMTVLPQTLWTTVAVAFSTFFSLFIGLFYVSINSNLKNYLKIGLFLSSLSYVVVSLCYTARDGIAFYLIYSIIFIINFWRVFSEKTKRILAPAVFGVAIVGSALLVSFTQDRFQNPLTGITGYIATQPYVFAENLERRVHENPMFYGLSLRFPLLQRIVGPVNDVQRFEAYEWTFGTFLTDFFNINGFFSLFFFLILFTEMFRYNFKNSRGHPLSFLLSYILYVHFIVSGVFYFRLGSFSGNVFIVVMLLLIYFSRKKIKII